MAQYPGCQSPVYVTICYLQFKIKRRKQTKQRSLMCQNSAQNKWLNIELCTNLVKACLHFFTLLISHINHIKYSIFFFSKWWKEKKSIWLTRNHFSGVFQHKKRTILRPVVTFLNGNLFQHVSSWIILIFFCYLQETFRTASIQRSLLVTLIWYFTECRQTAAGQTRNALALTCFVTPRFIMFWWKKQKISDINQHRWQLFKIQVFCT